MEIIKFTDNLKTYINTQLDTMSVNTPILNFMKPLIKRALDKNFNKVTNLLQLVADDNGNIDIENILTEMTEGLMNTNLFIYKTSFIGDVEIGGGKIVFNIPLTDKKLVLNTEDLQVFKDTLINNQ